MSLLNILILIAAALALRLLFPGKLRRWALLVSSVVAIYWLQPSLPIRQMDFWFPTATLGLVMIVWGLTAEKRTIQAQNKTGWQPRLPWGPSCCWGCCVLPASKAS